MRFKPQHSIRLEQGSPKFKKGFFKVKKGFSSPKTLFTLKSYTHESEKVRVSAGTEILTQADLNVGTVYKLAQSVDRRLF